MYLAYFDENKYSQENPYFFIGGFLVHESIALALESALIEIQSSFFNSSTLAKHTEFHGKEMFHGKGHFKGRKLNERLKLFGDLVDLIVGMSVPIRMVCIDVNLYRVRCAQGESEYKFGLGLILESFCHYLNMIDDVGIVFGDYEKDEVASAVVDFSELKRANNIGRLVDTVYFSHSHHSRFLQVADVMVYMAGRCENIIEPPEKWHDRQLYDLWQKIKANTDVVIQCWPEIRNDQSQ